MRRPVIVDGDRTFAAWVNAGRHCGPWLTNVYFQHISRAKAISIPLLVHRRAADSTFRMVASQQAASETRQAINPVASQRVNHRLSRLFLRQNA